MCIRCEIEELLDLMCECDGRFECEWHELLMRERRETVVAKMRSELEQRHYAWAVQQTINDLDEE